MRYVENIAGVSGKLGFEFERTQADVDRVKELNKKMTSGTATQEEIDEWGNDLIGALNLSDINRVSTQLNVLSELLGITIDLPVLSNDLIIGGTRYSYNMMPTDNYYRTLINDVDKFNLTNYAINTPDTPIQPLNIYTKWNDIEEILYIVLTQFLAVNSMYGYVGEDTRISDKDTTKDYDGTRMTRLI